MVNWLRWGKRGDGQTERDRDRPIVHFAEIAHQKLLEILASRGSAPGALRISAEQRGLGEPDYGMAIEDSTEPRPGDTVIEAGGFRVLVDAQSLPHVNGATVHFVDDPLRPGFQVEPPASAPAPHAHPAAPPRSRPQLNLSDPVVATVQAVIDQHINPGIAAHGGRATLIDVKDDVVYVELGGGCQGCAMASVTLKQGVEQLIKRAVPHIREVLDVTDHAGGTNPYYTSAKGGESPFYQPAKG